MDKGIDTPDAGVSPKRETLWQQFARLEDGEIVRWAFGGLLIGTAGVLAFDFIELADRNGWQVREVLAQPVGGEPILPPAVEADRDSRPSRDPRGDLTADEAELRQPLRFSLKPGGMMEMTGSIDPGSAVRFQAELGERGEYVTTVSLNSPGGSLEDALAMARLIRDKGLATRVEDGALCASSCPLILAAGERRSAGDRSAVGLHQFYAAGGELPGPAQAMSDAQVTTARITRHLSEMGVDPALWLHALETPPRQLYYLTGEELARYRLVSSEPPLAATGAAEPRS